MMRMSEEDLIHLWLQLMEVARMIRLVRTHYAVVPVLREVYSATSSSWPVAYVQARHLKLRAISGRR